VREAYGWFGLEPRFAFATKPDKALGDPALWERAEQLIREAFAAADISYVLKPKDGTFYAPKIDIYIDDALGREWQMATIQVDLVGLPERFDLTYIDEAGQPQRPIAIHRAIYGSLERFIGILVEHFAGAFPLWLAPVQAVVIPIADRHGEAAEELAEVLRARGLRVEVDTSDNRMQNKIRLAQEQKVPYMLVLGDREIEARTVAPRARNAARGEQQEAVPSDELEKARNVAKGRFVLQTESPHGLVMYGLRREVLEGEATEPEEVLAGLDAVTAQDVQRVAQDVLGGHGLNLALIGPFEQDQQEHFEQLLA